MFVRKKKFGPVDQREYFYLVKSVRVPNRKTPKQIYIDYLGPVSEREEGKCPICGKEEGKCPICGKEKTIYPKYNCCENCMSEIPELKAIAERKTKRAKRKI